MPVLTPVKQEIPFAAWTRQMSQSTLREILALIARPGLLSFALGMPAAELFPVRAYARAAQRVLRGQPDALQYAMPLQRLRAQVVELMARRGVRCTEREVFITTGAQQAMSLLGQLLATPGDTVVTEDLAYDGMVGSMRPLQPRVLTVPSDPQTGMDLDALEALLASEDRPSLIYAIPEGHNPLGATLSAASRRRLAALARRHRVPVIEDDAYGLLSYGQDTLPALRSYDPDWVLYVGSFSKIMAPGLRTGWVVAPEAVVQRLSILKQGNDLDVSSFAQRALAAYLDREDMDGHLAHLRAVYGARRDAMLDALARHFPADARWSRPHAGMFVWVELANGVDTTELLRRAVDEAGVAFVPGRAFCAAGGERGGNGLRLNFSCLRPEAIEEGVGRLGRLLAPHGAALRVRVPGHVVGDDRSTAVPVSTSDAARDADDGAAAATLRRGLERLRTGDPALHALLAREHRRQAETLTMVAASSIADPAVLACQGSALLNTTTEGYPGARFHAGCEVVDEIERLAIDRARHAFGARFANVQPHSGTSANQVVMFSLLRPGDTVLGLDLDAGGHLSHGARASVSGVYFHAVAYGVDGDGRIDMDEVRRLALEHRPRLIVCGASAYPRTVDFAAFRRIADEAGAYLLADISHVAGLVAAGEHPSPIDHAHFTTTSTYKQLCGPRGGLVLMGRDHDAPAPDGRGTLSDLVQRAAFPFFQGTPDLAAIAAKASALGRVASPAFRESARRIVTTARALADALAVRGYDLVSGGTDNHIVLVDLTARGVTGVVAERALESCGIVVNKNRIPGDRRSATVTSGVRFGTNGLALRGMGPAEMPRCAELVDRVLSAVTPCGDRDFVLDDRVADAVRAEVAALCARFPLPGYGAGDDAIPADTVSADAGRVRVAVAAPLDPVSPAFSPVLEDPA